MSLYNTIIRHFTNYQRRLNRLTQEKVNLLTLLMHSSFSLSLWYQLKHQPFYSALTTESAGHLSIFASMKTLQLFTKLFQNIVPPLHKLKKNRIFALMREKGEIIFDLQMAWNVFIFFGQSLEDKQLSFVLTVVKTFPLEAMATYRQCCGL